MPVIPARPPTDGRTGYDPPLNLGFLAVEVADRLDDHASLATVERALDVLQADEPGLAVAVRQDQIDLGPLTGQRVRK